MLIDEQIAANRRRSVVYVTLFFLVWVGIGALGGLVFASSSSSSQYGSSTAGDTTSSATGYVVTGIALFGGLAVLGILYSVRAGAGLVLRVVREPAPQIRSSTCSSTTSSRDSPSRPASRSRRCT